MLPTGAMLLDEKACYREVCEYVYLYVHLYFGCMCVSCLSMCVCECACARMWASLCALFCVYARASVGMWGTGGSSDCVQCAHECAFKCACMCVYVCMEICVHVCM
jgi:hypothetical protein